MDTFKLVYISNDAGPGELETPDSTTPDTAFRWSATDQQWIFNLNTKPLSVNLTYTYEIKLLDGSIIQFKFKTK